MAAIVTKNRRDRRDRRHRRDRKDKTHHEDTETRRKQFKAALRDGWQPGTWNF
jgi:hypothetical protein